MEIPAKIKEFINKLNEKGIPVPLVKDPTRGPSVSLTLVFISFNVWLASIIGKVTGLVGGMDSSQALNMFMVCAGLYWGRKLQASKDGVKMEGKEE